MPLPCLLCLLLATEQPRSTSILGRWVSQRLRLMLAEYPLISPAFVASSQADFMRSGGAACFPRVCTFQQADTLMHIPWDARNGPVFETHYHNILSDRSLCHL